MFWYNVNTIKNIKMKKHLLLSIKTTLFLLMALLINFSSVYTPADVAKAESINSLRAQVAELEKQIRENSEKAADMATEADSLKKKIADYDFQISGVERQIQLTDLKIKELEQQLISTQDELERQKDLLKTALVALYKRGDASSLELIVGSQSFTQFVNEQEYLARLKVGIQKSTEKVIELKQQITDNKKQQQDLQARQERQKSSLEQARVDRQNTLQYTKGQEANYRAMVEDLKKQQIEINRRIFAQSATSKFFPGDPNKGGYPAVWANAPMDTIVDTWGMLNRECVSYTAYKVAASGRKMPRNWPSYYYKYGPGHGGNARDWVGDAAIDGIPYDRTPKAGSIGILVAGTYGHAVYVERVLENNQVYISHYNYDYKGNYAEGILDYTKANWYFIHFP